MPAWNSQVSYRDSRIHFLAGRRGRITSPKAASGSRQVTQPLPFDEIQFAKVNTVFAPSLEPRPKLCRYPWPATQILDSSPRR
jgi:hypothetical protein